MAQINKTREKGTGTIYKEGKRFYFKIRVNGKIKTQLLRDQEDKPVTTRQAAEKVAALLTPILRARQKEEIALYIADAKNLKKRSSAQLDDLWTLFLSCSKHRDMAPGTLEVHHSAVKSFLKWVHHAYPEFVKLDQIDSRIPLEYFKYLSDQNFASVTRNKYRKSLRLVFKVIMESVGLSENPFEKIEQIPERPISRREFTEEQVESIFKGFTTGFFFTANRSVLGPGRKRVRKQVRREFVPMHKDEMFVLLNLCCWTGCRGQDGCQMKWDNVDWVNRQITYVPRKTAKKTAYRAVSLPIHPNLLSALEKAKEWRAENLPGEDYILPKVAHRYLSNPSGVQKDVMKIIRCATGLETTGKKNTAQRVRNPNLYSLHSFRHTFVSFCANAGVPLDVVASIVGHGSVAMTRHYAHISDAAKGKAIQALPVLRLSDAPESDPEKEDLLKELSSLSAEQLAELIKATKNPLSVENLKAM